MCIRDSICGHLAKLLRLKTVSRSDVTYNDVIDDHVGSADQQQNDKAYESGREQIGHEGMENNDVSKVECVGQKDGNDITSSDVLCGIRDLLEPKNQTPIASSSAAAAAAGQSISPVERLLASINDMMETRLRSDDQLRHQRDKNQQMMNEWMIAAAVIDRICFIVFGFCSLIGTTVLFFLAIFVENVHS